MRQFNFRDVLQITGIPMCNETNWAVGQMLVRLAADHGMEPSRILTEKTDPDPSVAAPHVIAHYDPVLFREACETVLRWWGDKNRQLSLL